MGSPRREAEKVLGMLDREMEVERQWSRVSVVMSSSVRDARQDAVETGLGGPEVGPPVSQEMLSKWLTWLSVGAGLQ